IVPKAKFDGHVAALGETGFAEALTERCYNSRAEFGRTRKEKSNNRHGRLLCVPGKGPRGSCNANQRDELAPFNCPIPPVLPDRTSPRGARARAQNSTEPVSKPERCNIPRRRPRRSSSATDPRCSRSHTPTRETDWVGKSRRGPGPSPSIDQTTNSCSCR